MVVGEAPGFREDGEGRPFIGRSGSFLRTLLGSAGLTDVHFANRVMCRPPDNLDPLQSELDNCSPWLVEHIREVDPEIVILVGRHAMSWRLPVKQVGAARGLFYSEDCDGCGVSYGHEERWAEGGQWLAERSHPVKRRLYLASYHPAARREEQREALGADLARIRNGR